MKIPSVKQILQHSRQSLATARQPRQAIAAYAGVTALTALAVSVVSVLLENKIATTGGLSNLGLRSVLSTVQTLLPIVQYVVLMCLSIGYSGAVLRFARGQYADQTDVYRGFRLTGPVLRLNILRGLIYIAILLAVTNIATELILLTPLGTSITESLTPLLENGALPEDPQALVSIYSAMLPAIVLALALFALLAIPLTYRYRMATYCLIDHPRQGAIAALRSSRHLMRKNCFRLFRLDLHFWWYYLLSALAAGTAYTGSVLDLLGISLPLPASVTSLLIGAVSLLIQFAVLYAFQNRVEIASATVYESIRPQENTDGVVLGNIFDMQ